MKQKYSQQSVCAWYFCCKIMKEEFLYCSQVPWMLSMRVQIELILQNASQHIITLQASSWRSFKWVICLYCTAVCSVDITSVCLYTQTIQYSSVLVSLLSLSLQIPFSFTQWCPFTEISVIKCINPILQMNVVLKVMHEYIVKRNLSLITCLCFALQPPGSFSGWS